MFILFNERRPLPSFGSDIPRCVSDSELPGRGDVSRQLTKAVSRLSFCRDGGWEPGPHATTLVAALRRHVAEGVRVFLAAYGTPPSSKRQVKGARRR